MTPRAKNSGAARTIDHFLQSLAADQKGNAIGVILSGAGSDGAKGLAAIKQAGGVTLAQDQASSKYDSMPRSAIETRRGFNVSAASSMAEARTLAEGEAFDLVISDLELPDGDGCDFWTELSRSQPRLMGIALSGYGMEDDIARSRACGFSEHLTKPINIKSLDRAIISVGATRV